MTPLIDISSTCGAKCGYCLHQSLGLAPKRFMDFSVFTRIVRILKAEGVHRAHMYMTGEPLYHPRFLDCLWMLVSFEVTTTIASKLPVPIDILRLAGIIEKSVVPVIFQITVDSLDQKKQSKIAPGIRTSIVKRNVEGLAALARHTKRLVIKPVSVINRFNENDLGSIRKYFRNLGLPWSAKAMGFYMGRKITPDAARSIKTLIPKTKAFRSRFDSDGMTVRSMGKGCPFRNPGISVDGNVTVCCHDMLFDVNAGNVLEAGSLLKILNSPQYKRLRELGNKRQLPICKGCN